MRAQASVLHLDLDAFFAAVEQRDKPSLRGRPVVVGGTGGRGVVSTASYEARAFGVRSAMSTREARARCPHAAYLSGRFAAYRQTSRAVMDLLRSYSPLVEPLSLDEAFVDLTRADLPDLDLGTVTAFADRLRREVTEVTGGLTASVGLGSSKLIAKIASDLDKPDGLVVVPPGTERDFLRPLKVGVIPGVGPATAERLRRLGVHTVAELERLGEDELVREIGRAHGQSLFRLARAQDDRPVEPEREAKSVSVESTYEHDLTDRRQMEAILTRQAGEVARRLSDGGVSGRTVTIKVRLYDFSTSSRSSTLASPTDSATTIGRVARGLLADLDTSGGVRLLGVGVAGLADWVQEDLFGTEDEPGDEPGVEPGTPPGTADSEAAVSEAARSEAAQSEAAASRPVASGPAAPPQEAGARAPHDWPPGADVEHAEHGRGWVWGAGRGVVTVRFETAETGPGPVRSLRADDPDLHRWRPPRDEDGASG
ncbi:DNA polymerase IV [Nocardioides sp. GY 10113]|uniref:DNA polymerase IV n=1 Tax=Nocardioides sp. GY 10113 TaxID=2569761 RepID=UPI0010A83619|nr:DNA polymerase IV [Nocardioides sp. GY 10113]TIC88566.1 DNA polymerase IV [Nocardioides sp. GY 10113]